MNGKCLLWFIIIFPLIGCFIGYILGRRNEKYRDTFNIIMTGITFIAVMLLYRYVKIGVVEVSVPNVMGTGLHLKIDVFRYIFVWLASMVWFLTTIYSTQYLISYKNRNRYYLFFMLTLWSTIGIFISENILNLFTFFEIMSLTSYALVIHDEDDYSHEAGDTYIVMAVSGGLILLMGLFLLYDYTKTLSITELQVACQSLGNIKYLISTLIIIGFGVKAGMVPLHVWLPKAHPAAPAPASAILSGILLKTGIFGIIITMEIMGGDFIIALVILVLGFINMFLGGLLAMFQRNIKRILAYSSMSQIGYILIGIGLMGILKEHRAIAVYGTLYHIINHAIFKVLLFMLAGTIYMVLHELSINEIGGFGKNKKVLKILFFIGLCAIIGMPGFNGFASKNLLHEALSEAHHIYGGNIFILAEVIFTLSSAFTTAYLLKIFIAVFVEESINDFRTVKGRITTKAIIPMMILAGMVLYIGLKPDKIINVISGTMGTFNVKDVPKVHFYSFHNIKTSILTIFYGVIVYIGFVRGCLRKGMGKDWFYENIALGWFNLERDLYRPVMRQVFNAASVILRIIDESIIKSAAFIGNGFKALGKVEVAYDNAVLKVKNISKERFVTDKKGTAPMDESLFNIKDMVNIIGNIFNSITYSIFIFGAVLVVSLVILIK
ncbi:MULTISPECIES: complex I subunit 5 family protein [Clostridium]|uniref:Hydrogenase-4 component B n=2 Tax=Clostridium TaxID=1485 RepID=A0A151AM51_9CLOT|nr:MULTISPECIES: complex I subunit 5 family protein [Clostridium]KYH28682.1 hydrogenase-4 component B [Clostridium colicanis DSM 13634]MBE6044980.1 NADH dehydrogenase [Clostridium thermopalmarium]PRR73388.1 Hydrogenase-4 component B [Clostridium thermopalmarium DSM 5974]PVZ22126.1 formate hydrogenlyase subunit 3/multisubunit Na+/H+ antiporter MnhD subunit [Clostridium thermopalmarium DSM 5974]